MFDRQWLMLGGILAVAVIISIALDRPKTEVQTPTIKFHPTQGAGGGVVSNVADASSGLPGAGNLDDEDSYHID